MKSPNSTEVAAGMDRAAHWLGDIGRKKVASVPELGKEVSIRDREDRFHMLVEAVRDYAIFLLDPQGRVASWNSGAERIQGYTQEEVTGQNLSIFYLEDDVRQGKPRKLLQDAARLNRIEDEGWRVRKDGSKFWANVVITALRDQRGRLYGFAKVTHDLTEQKLAKEALQSSMAQLQKEIEQRAEAEKSVRDLSARLLQLQDEERRRVGRELHDSVGQLLAAAKMAVRTLGSTKDEQRFRDELAHCHRLIDQLISEVRTMSYILYPPMLEDIGLRSTAKWYVDGFRKRSGLQVSFHAPENFGRLSRDAELVLFRMLQESLTNVHRHSGSPTARVRLRTEGHSAILEVEDHGIGVPAEALDSSRDDGATLGVGLRGMNERIRQLGGKLEVISLGKGTTVRATLPLGEAARDGKQEREDLKSA